MILSFTGHRPDKLGDERNPIPAGAKMTAVDFLLVARPERCIVGMAQGWDMAVASACIDLNIPFTAAIPFCGQELCWPERVQKLYLDMINHRLATQHIVAPGGYSAGKMSLRNGWMVDHSDAVIALWNGTPGGTGNCVRYAKHVKRPILNLWPAYANELTLAPPTITGLWRDFCDSMGGR